MRSATPTAVHRATPGRSASAGAYVSEVRGAAGGLGWIGGVLALGVAALLLVRTVEAHRRNAGLYHRNVRVEVELDRLRAERESMKRELKALESDPLYVESQLRRLEVGSRREPVLEEVDRATETGGEHGLRGHPIP
ncbi:MAG: hypothetical protein HY716_17975 [Planctomycetes bacterium]|nr:hypothetical protein [Planctomycetota bacterium]